MTETTINSEATTGAAASGTAMTERHKSRRSLWRAAIVLIVAACCYEAVARSGTFAPALMPKLSLVAPT